MVVGAPTSVPPAGFCYITGGGLISGNTSGDIVLTPGASGNGVFQSASGGGLLLQDTRTVAANNSVGLTFKEATAAGRAKAGIFFVNVTGDGDGRGDIYFALNNTADSSNATPSQTKVVITRAGNTLIGGLTTDDGSSALQVQGTASLCIGANSQSIKLQTLTELTTIAAAATTDTTIQMPAGAIVLAVSVRVTVAIPTATSFSVGDSGSATRFSTTGTVSVAANTTDAGTKAGAYYNASALAVRLTMNGGVPAANTGRVRVTIMYLTSTAPTS